MVARRLLVSPDLVAGTAPARPVDPLPMALQSVTATGLRSSTARTPAAADVVDSRSQTPVRTASSQTCWRLPGSTLQSGMHHGAGSTAGLWGF